MKRRKLKFVGITTTFFAFNFRLSELDIYEEGVSSQFDRRLFRSRVHSVETKGQFDQSKGFDRRVTDDKL